MRKTVLILVLVGLGVTVAVGALRRHEQPPTPLERLKASLARRPQPAVDHSKLAALQGPFESGRDVTTACLSCHNGRAAEVMASTHWNWARREYVPGRGIRVIGKRNLLNNFCIGVSGNLEGCDSCHAGYGYTDQQYDFTDPRNIDCLACHDTSNTYVKKGGGMPAPTVDLKKVAQSVGRPTRANCGTCHFFGGGGNNVKHGDLEESLFDPPRDLDVHMARDGANLECADCHVTENHRMKGKLYSVSSMNRDRSTCEQCHGDGPHADDLLNEHTLKVACQTCHIPTYARANATKMTWDWSTAGRLRDGAPYEEHDAKGNITYASIKGSFTWGTHVVPEYIWFNGTASHYLLGDKVEGSGPLAVNRLFGSYADPAARLVPVKVHRAKQVYDPIMRTIIPPKLYAPGPGAGAFWRDFDWKRAAEEGMREVGLPHSGQHAFIETEMTWPINHMVAPKEQTVSCRQCHTREGSRLAGVGGLYLPGRDRSPMVDWIGSLALMSVIGAVLIHAGARVATRKRRGRR